MPGHMAVLGVDNDDMAAFRTPVPISNIVLPTYDIGRQTACLLIRLLRGDTHHPRKPTHIVERHSSAIDAIEDRAGLTANKFVHDHIDRDLNAASVANHVGARSRRTLERKFWTAVGNGVAAFISATRTEHACELLMSPALPIKQVAALCGFENPQYFTQVFKARRGITPARYRRLLAGSR